MTSAIKILVATHKDYEYPTSNEYIPVHVGSKQSPLRLGIQEDCEGENISHLNRSFCELTGLYWLWKNTQFEYGGLVHYRRYFKPLKGPCSFVGNQAVAHPDALVALLQKFDVLVPKKRRYYIDTVASQYIGAHYGSDLNCLIDLINKRYPEYNAALELVLSSRSLYLYNMFVMPRSHFDRYCEFLFGILFDLECVIPYRSYGPYQTRVFGFLSERIFNIWLLHNFPSKRIKELEVANLEGDSLVRKGLGLIGRKISGKKLV